MRLISTLILICSAFSLSAEGIQFFHGTWTEALAKAKEEGKIIFVDAYAEWCGPCKRMAANVFTDAAVGEFYNKHFINMKIDMEKPESIVFRKTHSVSAYPTLLFIDYDDSEVHKKVGALDVPRFIELGEKALGMVDRSHEYAPLYESGDRSPELVLNYIKSLNQAGKPSLKIVNDYVNGKPDFTDEKNLLILFEGTTQADSRIFDMMTRYQPQIVSIVGQPKLEEKIVEACRATLNTALEFQSSDLLEEAQSKCKDYVPNAFEGFELESNRQYALATKDSKLYLKSAKTIAADKALDVDSRQKMMHNIIQESLNVFDQDVKVMKLAESMANTLVSEDDSYGNRYTLANVQFMAAKYSDALENAQTALAQAKDKKINTRKIEILLKKIKERS